MRRDNTVIMAAFTLPHDAGDRLAATFDTVANGFRRVISGRAWQQVKRDLGVRGTIRSAEVTHGPNGWHPHLHVLVFVEGVMSAQDVAALAVYLRDRWAGFVTSAGYRTPHVLHGVDVQVCHHAEDAGAYLAKTQEGKSVGNEVARGDLKSGRGDHRTPLQLLEWFRETGDAEALGLWREYERATHGRQRITWSRGLRELVGAAPARTDDEIAADEVGGQIVALFDPDTWHQVTMMPGLPALILDEAERAGEAGILAALARFGVGPPAPVPEE
jgi:hypothetical protein